MVPEGWTAPSKRPRGPRGGPALDPAATGSREPPARPERRCSRGRRRGSRRPGRGRSRSRPRNGRRGHGRAESGRRAPRRRQARQRRKRRHGRSGRDCKRLRRRIGRRRCSGRRTRRHGRPRVDRLDRRVLQRRRRRRRGRSPEGPRRRGGRRNRGRGTGTGGRRGRTDGSRRGRSQAPGPAVEVRVDDARRVGQKVRDADPRIEDALADTDRKKREHALEEPRLGPDIHPAGAGHAGVRADLDEVELQNVAGAQHDRQVRLRTALPGLNDHERPRMGDPPAGGVSDERLHDVPLREEHDDDIVKDLRVNRTRDRPAADRYREDGVPENPGAGERRSARDPRRGRRARHRLQGASQATLGLRAQGRRIRHGGLRASAAERAHHQSGSENERGERPAGDARHAPKGTRRSHTEGHPALPA